MQPSAAAYAAGRNAYDPGEVDTGFGMGALRGLGTASLLTGIGIAVPPLGIAMLIAGAFYIGYDYGSRLMAGIMYSEVFLLAASTSANRLGS